MCVILFYWQELELTLLDIPQMMEALKGVVMELQDCALTLLKGLSRRLLVKVLLCCLPR